MVVVWIVNFTLIAYSSAKGFAGTTSPGLRTPLEDAHGESSKWSDYVDVTLNGASHSRPTSETENPEIFQPTASFIAQLADAKPTTAVKTQPAKPSRLGVQSSALDDLQTGHAFLGPVTQSSVLSVIRPVSVPGKTITKPFKFPDKSPGAVPRVSYLRTKHSPLSNLLRGRSSRAERSAPRSSSLTSDIFPARDGLSQTLSSTNDRVVPKRADLNTSKNETANAQTTSQHLSRRPVVSQARASVSTVIPELPQRKGTSLSGQKGLYTSTLWYTPDVTSMQTINATAGSTAAPRFVMRIDRTKLYVLVGVVLGLVVVAVTAALVIKKYISRWTCLR